MKRISSLPGLEFTANPKPLNDLRASPAMHRVSWLVTQVPSNIDATKRSGVVQLGAALEKEAQSQTPSAERLTPFHDAHRCAARCSTLNFACLG